MSKRGKQLHPLQNYFGFCYNKRPKSVNNLPLSAQKGKYSDEFKRQYMKTTKKKSQFYLSYRQNTSKNQLTQFYRMKSLLCPISHLKADNLRQFEIVGCFDKKIIVGFHPKLNIFAYFDQHAMHQRIRYEYYLDQLQNFNTFKMKQWDNSVIQKDGSTVKIISRIKYSYISFQISSKLDQNIQNDTVILKYGFEIEYIKQKRLLKILKVPDILQRTLDNQLILNIAHDLIFNNSRIPKCMESIIAQISCKSAYKFNDQIQVEKIYKLLKNLSLCRYPFFCVHGRPTLFTKT